MFDFPIRFRWLLALMVALSLIAPHRISPDSLLLSPQTAQTRVLAADSGAEDGAFGELESLELLELPADYGDAHSSDYPQEMDKILSLFFPHWGTVAVPWDGVYFASLSPDPVFPFDRPPKTARGAA
ncbi:MAG: hypothetical protein LBS49_11650 [Candidatus Accumulibacter sp.]|nr:hypothetical protein [Accumulibacter sp.]